METAGEFLRKQREARGRTLEEISRKTNIKSEVLRNLEADLFNFAPAEVYVTGALTAYARALGLDPAEVLERYRGAALPPVGVVAEEPEAPGGGLWGGARAWITVGVVILVVVVVLLLGRRGPEETLETRPAVPIVPAVQETVQVDLPEPAVERIVLEMSVEESTWVGLEMDRADRYSALLPPGTWRRWEADSVFSITIGNAGGVTLTLDGEPVDFPKLPGRVVILELPRKGQLGRARGGPAQPSEEHPQGLEQSLENL